MKKFVAILSALVVASAGIVFAADVESGLKVGDTVGAYNVKDITGPNKGKSLCYRCNYGARPVVNVFARDVNDNLVKLIKEVDGIVENNKDKKMAAFVVVLAEDADKVAPKLEEIAKANGIKNVPLTIFDGEAGPSNYNIAKNADVTVLMWNKGEVKANYAFEQGKLGEEGIKSIVTDTAKILK